MKGIFSGPPAAAPPIAIQEAEKRAGEVAQRLKEGLALAPRMIDQRLGGGGEGDVGYVERAVNVFIDVRRSTAGYVGREWAVRSVERGLRDVELLEGLLDGESFFPLPSVLCPLSST